jgi:hypothetical protein
MGKGLIFAACILGLSACASGSSAIGSASRSNDTGRMDVHPSMARASEEEAAPEEDGPEPGETFASPPAETIPPGTLVPDIRGMDFEDAVITLRKLGMDFGFVVGRTSPADAWTVLEQTPQPGDPPAHGGRVAMVVSMGREVSGVVGIGGVACKPEEDDIDEPYCAGKILRYS